MSSGQAITTFLDGYAHVALVEVTRALGSTPREAGAWMLVADDATCGTIGGGQLEFMAIEHARRMLASGGEAETLDVPLGPEIGQCCGGRTLLALLRLDADGRARMLDRAEHEEASRPHVHLFGGGHVGRALAEALSLLPVTVLLADTRAEALVDLPPGVTGRHAAVPEELVRAAPAGSAFVVLTHDHALDFLIAAEALARSDADYVGMIGSATKRAMFASWYLKTAGGSAEALERLVMPIGGNEVRDKRPAVIAALAAAEIMTRLSARAGSRGSSAGSAPP